MHPKLSLTVIILSLSVLTMLPVLPSNLNKQFTPLQGVYTIKKTPLNAQAIKSIEKNISYTFKEKKHLIKALTTEKANPKNNMENYELYGDKILKTAQALMLRTIPQSKTPGNMSNAMQAIESLAPLCALGVRLELHKYIQDINTEIKSSVIEDAMEALIWAIHKDGGSEASEKFMTRFFYPMIANHKVMPLLPQEILRKAFPNKCLHYKAIENTTNNIKCNLQIIEKSNTDYSREGFAKSKDKKKNPQPKIAEYNTCYQYILNNLPKEYQQQLISWPLSDNYMEYNDTLNLNIDWQKCFEDPHLRLHNLCAKLKVDFHFQEQANNDSFMSTVEVRAPFNCTQKATALNKKAARKKAAQKVLASMQKKIILHPQLHALNMFDLAQSLVEDMSSHKAMLNRVCQNHNLEKPQIKTRVQENLISEPIAYITEVNAPWLIKPFEADAYPTAKEAQRAAHELTLKKIIKYLKQTHNNACDLKKLTLLKYVQNAQSNQNKTKRELLNELKEKADLKLTYHDYRVSDENYQLKYRSTIVMDQHTIKGNPQVSLASAQEDAATKALKRFITNVKQSLLNPPKEQPKDKKNIKKITVATSKKSLSLNCSASSTQATQTNNSSKKIVLQQTYINNNQATNSAHNKPWKERRMRSRRK